MTRNEPVTQIKNRIRAISILAKGPSFELGRSRDLIANMIISSPIINSDIFKGNPKFKVRALVKGKKTKNIMKRLLNFKIIFRNCVLFKIKCSYLLVVMRLVLSKVIIGPRQKKLRTLSLYNPKHLLFQYTIFKLLDFLFNGKPFNCIFYNIFL